MTFSFELLTTVLLIIAGVFLVGILILFKKYYTRLEDIKSTADKAWGYLDADLTKRAREIARLINIGETYIKTTCEPLTNLIHFSRRYKYVPSQAERIKMDKGAVKIINDFINTAQQYAELKNHAHFVEIVNIIAHVNSDIDKSRKNYNQKAEQYNKQTGLFPYTILPIMLFYKKMIYFTDPKDTQKITEVKFNLPMPPIEIKSKHIDKAFKNQTEDRPDPYKNT